MRRRGGPGRASISPNLSRPWTEDASPSDGHARRPGSTGQPANWQEYGPLLQQQAGFLYLPS
eukprot:9323224-Pyramimonas_sp.AAC.1